MPDGGEGRAEGRKPVEKLSEKEIRAELSSLRDGIVEVDQGLIRLVGRRKELVLRVGRLKEALGMPVMDPGREARVVRRAAERAREMGVDEELTRDVIWRIIASAREAQEGTRGWSPQDYPPPADSDDEG